MKLTRSRITFALIGLLLVGGVSAAVAVLTTPHPTRLALTDVRRGNAAPTATATGVATTTTTTAAPTLPPVAQPTATATTPPPPQPTKAATLTAGQSVDISGRVTSVDNSSQTFTMTWQGSIVTVDVSGSPIYSGDAQSLSAIKVGWSAEVHGVVQANGYLKATEVNASSGN